MGMQKCWSCKKYAGGCSWSREFRPIPGWDATPRAYGANPKYGVSAVNSYEIRDCPQYEWDGTDPREQTDAEGAYRWTMEERLAQVRGLRNAGMSAWKIGKTLKMSWRNVQRYLNILKENGELNDAE